MDYRHLIKNQKYCQLYGHSYAKDMGCVAQGIPGQVEETNTVFFQSCSSCPGARWREFIYGRMVVKYRPKKDDPYRTCLTVIVNNSSYPSDCGTPTIESSPSSLSETALYQPLVQSSSPSTSKTFISTLACNYSNT